MPDWTMKCRECGGDLGDLPAARASICLRPREDEDRLIAVGPVSREEGDRIVARIRECPSPDLAWCRCPVHEELNGTLA